MVGHGDRHMWGWGDRWDAGMEVHGDGWDMGRATLGDVGVGGTQGQAHMGTWGPVRHRDSRARGCGDG